MQALHGSCCGSCPHLDITPWRGGSCGQLQAAANQHHYLMNFAGPAILHQARGPYASSHCWAQARTGQRRTSHWISNSLCTMGRKARWSCKHASILIGC